MRHCVLLFEKPSRIRPQSYTSDLSWGSATQLIPYARVETMETLMGDDDYNKDRDE
jgi:hypothetical protein